jgi:hypothetical protein
MMMDQQGIDRSELIAKKHLILVTIMMNGQIQAHLSLSAFCNQFLFNYCEIFAVDDYCLCLGAFVERGLLRNTDGSSVLNGGFSSLPL